MKKFEVTIIETDEGIEMSFIDYERKEKMTPLKLGDTSVFSIQCKSILSTVQRAQGISVLIADKK